MDKAYSKEDTDTSMLNEKGADQRPMTLNKVDTPFRNGVSTLFSVIGRWSAPFSFSIDVSVSSFEYALSIRQT